LPSVPPLILSMPFSGREGGRGCLRVHFAHMQPHGSEIQHFRSGAQLLAFGEG